MNDDTQMDTMPAPELWRPRERPALKVGDMVRVKLNLECPHYPHKGQTTWDYHPTADNGSIGTIIRCDPAGALTFDSNLRSSGVAHIWAVQLPGRAYVLAFAAAELELLPDGEARP